MKKVKKETRGGKRSFSGRKKADYETKTISFRVRVEFAEPIKQMVKDYVSADFENANYIIRKSVMKTTSQIDLKTEGKKNIKKTSLNANRSGKRIGSSLQNVNVK